MNGESWSDRRTWAALRHPGRETIVVGEADRASITRLLDLETLDHLSTTISYEPWFDGARISGRVKADAFRLCGVTLEPLNEHVETEFEVRVVPEGSAHAPKPEAELVVILDADDPPDVVSGGEVDLALYITEALGLALDPFPRKPGAEFDYVDSRPESSPFAVLLRKGESN